MKLLVIRIFIFATIVAGLSGCGNSTPTESKATPIPLDPLKVAKDKAASTLPTLTPAPLVTQAPVHEN